MSEVAVHIHLEEAIHSSGGAVSGCASLTLPSPSYISKVELRVYKKFMARHRALPVNGFIEATAERSCEQILSDSVFVLYRNPFEFSELSSGQHFFPFQVQLRNESGSVDAQLFFESGHYKVKNQYLLEAIVYKRVEYKIERISKTEEIYVIDRRSVEQKMSAGIDFSYCFCLFSSHGTVDTVLDKKFYFSGDIAKLRISRQQDTCKVAIKSVAVELYQYLEVHIDGERMFDQKLVTKTKGYPDPAGDGFLADIRLPFALPSNVNEKYLKLRNILNISVCFDMSLPVHIQRDISIVKNQLKVATDNVACMLEGLKQPLQFFHV
jgi:hypothetical protein